MRIRNQKNRGKVQLRQGLPKSSAKRPKLCPDFELSSQLGFAGSTPLLVDTVGLMGSHLSSPIKILNWWDSRVHWSYPLRLLVASSFWIMIEYCQSVWAATGYLSHAIANPQGSQRYPVMTHDPCPDSGCLCLKKSLKSVHRKSGGQKKCWVLSYIHWYFHMYIYIHTYIYTYIYI